MAPDSFNHPDQGTGFSGKEKLAVILALCCLFLIGYLGKTIQPDTSGASLLEYADLGDSEAAPVVAMLGELRASVSYILFMKTEEYLHAGIRYRPLTEKEKDLGREEIHHDHDMPDAEEAKDRSQAPDFSEQLEADPLSEMMRSEEQAEEQEEGHSHGAQIVPPKEWDVRGIWGDLEREIKPYEEIEPDHGDAHEMLPWYRLATYMNPRFVKAYVIGGFVVAAYGGNLEEAEAFLREGERMNPESLEIKEALGRHLMHRKKDSAAAKPYLQQAIALGKKKKELSDDEAFSFRRAYANLVLLEWRSNNDSEAALQVIEDGLILFPEDQALLHLKEQLES